MEMRKETRRIRVGKEGLLHILGSIRRLEPHQIIIDHPRDKFDIDQQYERWLEFTRQTVMTSANFYPLQGCRLQFKLVFIVPPPGRIYICVCGVRDEEHAKCLHAVFSKKEVRSQYDPPMKICYRIGSIVPLGSDTRDVQFTKLSENSLCGARIRTRGDDAFHNSTAGGLVQVDNELYALTAIHTDPINIEKPTSFDPSKIKEDEYDEDIEPALVIDEEGEKSGHPSHEQPSAGEHLLSGNHSTPIWDIRASGEDWALLDIKHYSKRLPNATRILSEGSNLEEICYLSTVAKEPIPTAVEVLAGVSGVQPGYLLSEPSLLLTTTGFARSVWTVDLETTNCKA
jgi:hypothetical protein